MSKTKYSTILKNGLVTENPTFVQMLGMCPTLGVTVSIKNGIGMGLATTAVLIMANAAISALRKVIPSKIRIPAFIVVIASAVTIVGMLMETYMASLYEVLGLFIPLIVVNCIILARAEAFAFENKVMPSVFDGIGMGLGFTISLGLIGTVREFFGGFSLFDIPIFTDAEPMLIFIQPPGAFLTLALLLALYNFYNISKAKKAKAIVDAEREASIAAQLEATRVSEEKWKQKQEEKKRKEAEKKKAEAEAKKKAEEEAKANEAVAETSAEAPKEEANKEMTPEEAEAERKRLKREQLKAKQAAQKAAEEAKTAEEVKASDEKQAESAEKKDEIVEE